MSPKKAKGEAKARAKAKPKAKAGEKRPVDDDVSETPEAKQNRREMSLSPPATSQASSQSSGTAVADKQLSELSTVNSQLWAQVAEWVGIVKNNQVFMDIEQAAPLDITTDEDDESGFQDAFAESKFTTAVDRTNKYRCAQNLFKHNLFKSPSPGMPIRESAITAYMEFYFQTPAPIPGQVVVALANGKHPIKNSSEAYRMSPDEPVIAWFKKVASVIRAGAPEDELAAWRCAALQTGYEYHRVHSGDNNTNNNTKTTTAATPTTAASTTTPQQQHQQQQQHIITKCQQNPERLSRKMISISKRSNSGKTWKKITLRCVRRPCNPSSTWCT